MPTRILIAEEQQECASFLKNSFNAAVTKLPQFMMG